MSVRTGSAHLIIGKLSSGKTTLAKKIAQTNNAVVLSCDELMLALHPVDSGFDYEDQLLRIKRYLLCLAPSILSTGTDVVLDWGFWIRSERDEVHDFFRAASLPQRWYCLQLSDDEWHKRIAQRNREIKSGKTGEYYINDGLLKKCESRYQEPDNDEIKQKRIMIYDK